jgi:hypothetical protein
MKYIKAIPVGGTQVHVIPSTLVKQEECMIGLPKFVIDQVEY